MEEPVRKLGNAATWAKQADGNWLVFAPIKQASVGKCIWVYKLNGDKSRVMVEEIIATHESGKWAWLKTRKWDYEVDPGVEWWHYSS